MMRLSHRIKYAWHAFRHPDAMSGSVAVVRAMINGKSDEQMTIARLDGSVEVYKVRIEREAQS